MRKGRNGETKRKNEETKMIMKIVATYVVASRPPNVDRLQRRRSCQLYLFSLWGTRKVGKKKVNQTFHLKCHLVELKLTFYQYWHRTVNPSSPPLENVSYKWTFFVEYSTHPPTTAEWLVKICTQTEQENDTFKCVCGMIVWVKPIHKNNLLWLELSENDRIKFILGKIHIVSN